ncbi:MAG: Thymidine kinase [Firmicutes bacterium]|nr:Thymidine kinase [Bacillota bacterium]MDI6705169.1 thymidine kinase [Bacillota bacterium]
MAKLYFKYSSMNAGKSLDLIKSNFNYVERNLRTIIFTSAIDDRWGKDKIYSRAELSLDAISVNPAFDMFDYVKQRLESESIHCVFVDEAQFLTKQQVYQLTEIVDRFNIPTIAYGLRTDFLGNLFEGSQWLLAWADVLDEIRTICWCEKKATFNMRVQDGKKVMEGEQILVGGNDLYLSVCRKHWKDGKTKPE